jgi:hypothetical protein
MKEPAAGIQETKQKACEMSIYGTTLAAGLGFNRRSLEQINCLLSSLNNAVIRRR